MKTKFFSEYSTNNVHFFDEIIPALLEAGLFLVSHVISKLRIVDLGCGDGRLIFALYKRRLLHNADDVVGVDVSEERLKRLKAKLPFVRVIASSALNIKELPASSCDFVICSQLIEHVDDKALLLEIKRLLTEVGIAYISSVVKSWYGFYFYFSNGAFLLDPTHVREYSSVKEFTNLILKKNFEIIGLKSQQLMFPIFDIVIRFLVKFNLVKPDANFYQQHPSLSKVRKFKLPIIGYRICEVLVKRK
jgi:ubiquinone/menaquinone biosynthesis C-methylase UbiE